MSRFIDLTSKRINDLTVLYRDIEYQEKNNFTELYWMCRCERCGGLERYTGRALRKGTPQCCKKCAIYYEDLAGQKFNMLTALYRDFDYEKEHNTKKTHWRCKCECGNETTVWAGNLKSGDVKSCGCLRKTSDNIYPGLNVNNFTVIGRAYQFEKDNNATSGYWICRCVCGRELILSTKALNNKHIKSCGCARKFTDAVIDLTGLRFGKLLVLYRDIEYEQTHLCKGAHWRCLCDCGKEITVYGAKLRKGNTRSCGCLRTETLRERYFEDLTDKKFTRLYVENLNENFLEEHPKAPKGTYWNCLCDCGNRCVINGKYLKNGDTKSCGCLVSLGETLIKKLLTENNIPFEYQKTFNTCRLETNNLEKFDFYIDNRFLLEYDGAQHYTYHNKGWNDKDKFENLQMRDKIKNQWCKDNNIPLKRIPYWDLDKLTIEDILGDKYLIKE